MKIRNTIFRLLAVATVICTSYSCSDDLFTEQPGNRITPDQHYRSLNDLSNSAVGIYSQLQTAMPRLLLVDGLRSDLMDVTINADPYMNDLNEQKLSASNPYIDGVDFYKAIININEMIKHVNEVWINEPTSITYLPKQVNGVLIAFRAWCYFTLVQMYGEAAFISDNMASLETNQVFLNKKDLIDTLINQLRPYLLIKSTEGQEVSFGPDVKIMAGELYLENGQYYNNYYDSAALYLRRGMELQDQRYLSYYKVSTTYQMISWKDIFRSKFGWEENYDEIPFFSHNDQSNDFVGWTLNYLVKPTQILIDSYKKQIPVDTTKVGDIFRGKGVTVDTIPNKNEYYISKYNIEKGDPFSSRIPYFRAADFHLLLAEALVNMATPDTAAAMALMNDGISKAAGSTITKFPPTWSVNLGIRSRVGLLQRRIPLHVDITNPDSVRYAIEDLILEERALELAYEGKRWFDLVRIAERRNDPNYLATKVALKFGDYNVPGSKAERILNILKDKANWYLPKK
jgi:starch-binding outer membrane protein, SusD/RagB family